jgi:hypothetical protein
VGHIFGELGSHSFGSNLSIHVGRETHAESECGRGTHNISSLAVVGETTGTGDGKVGSPGVVQVHLS